MSPSFVGSIFIFGGSFQILDWQYCAGQTIAISNNETLFTLIGTTYGGDGVSTFNLPDLRGRAAINQGQGPGLSNYTIGQAAGSESATMTVNTMPSHMHLLNANTASGTTATPNSSTYLASPYANGTAQKFYNTAAGTGTLGASTILNTGSGLPFSIIQPVMAVNYLIAMFGVFPTRN